MPPDFQTTYIVAGVIGGTVLFFVFGAIVWAMVQMKSKPKQRKQLDIQSEVEQSEVEQLLKGELSTTF